VRNIGEASYWSELYQSGSAGWDIGNVSTPLKDYFDQLSDKSVRILIPGAGFAWEAQYLHQQGFTLVFVLDFAIEALEGFRKNNPGFPEKHLICEDFFKHQGEYDLIIEQTFFCALPRNSRRKYMTKMHELLHPEGILAGLLFNHEFPSENPPFGGSEAEYLSLLEPVFHLKKFETANNSIRPRSGREFFFVAKPKQNI
jgi:SAM-dependent methyltransferase